MLWNQYLRFATVLAALSCMTAPAGCRVIDDPDHCANREGDATCEAEFPGRSCSTCQRAFSGCSEAPVEAACRPSATGEPTDAMTTAESSTSIGTGTGTGTGGSSTTEIGPTECEGEGAQAACPEDRPYCVDGACSGCEPAGGHAYCEGLDAAAPQCNADWGRCVVCVDDDSPVCQAAGNFCTTEFVCGGCMRQAQCPDSACNVWSGECMDDAMALWIAPSDDACSDSNAGSEVAPLCTVAEADSRVSSGAAGIFYLGNGAHTVSLSATNRDIALIGVGTIVLTQESVDAPGLPGVDLRGGSRYIVHNLRMNGGAAPALVCLLDARVALEGVEVVGGTPHAIDATSCNLLLQRSRVTNDRFFIPGAQGTVQFTSTTSPRTLRLDSSMIALRSSEETEFPTIHINASMLDVRGSTIIALEDGAKILECDRSTTGTVHSALLSANPTASGIDCPGVVFDHSVTDSTTLTGEGLVRLPFSFSWFRDLISDLRLDDGAAVEELTGIGRWQLGDPRLDYDGGRLPTVPGTPIDPGGDQR